jgi:formylglycine-generating enzyme required for sulfatase activity
MLLTFDKTDFPLLVLDGVGVEVHLLPITKAQFEPFATASPLIGPERYREMLALNPVVAPAEFTVDNREQLFISGILPDEALAFARWLGQGFDLPTVAEWRAILAALRHEPPPRQRVLTDVVEGPARAILHRLEEQSSIRTMLDYSLMRDGLVEWVRQDKGLTGLGRPRLAFHPNLWNPLAHTINPINPQVRLPYFGFRLVRRGEWYLHDRQKTSNVF